MTTLARGRTYAFLGSAHLSHCDALSYAGADSTIPALLSPYRYEIGRPRASSSLITTRGSWYRAVDTSGNTARQALMQPLRSRLVRTIEI